MPTTHPITLAACAAMIAGAAVSPTADAGILFADSFRYANGNLSGNSGGTGWSGAWAGGTGAGGNQVTSALVPGDATARSIRISSNASTTTRSLSTTYTTGGGSYYVSFVFNASPYSAPNNGDYAGVSLYLSSDRVNPNPPTSGNSLFLGMPGSSGKLGFDWTNRGDGLYTAASATNYLVLCAITPDANSTTTVSMYATTNLAMSGSALAGSTAFATLTDSNFSFDAVEVAGGYDSGTINFAGLAMADNPNDAVTFTQNAVPGPGGAALAVILGAMGTGGRRRR